MTWNEEFNKKVQNNDVLLEEYLDSHYGKKLSESSLNRVIAHGKEGMIIISTARNIVVPENGKGSYDFNSWQSLFKEYLVYCIENNLQVLNEVNADDLDITSLVDLINTNGYTLNSKTEEEFLKDRNHKCDQELWKYLSGKFNPYNFLPIWGGYLGKNGEEITREPSFIVFNSINPHKEISKEYGDWEDLKSKALSWCKKYKQDSVYIQAPDKAPVYFEEMRLRAHKPGCLSEKIKITYSGELWNI